jgi:hypothetical protein
MEEADLPMDYADASLAVLAEELSPTPLADEAVRSAARLEYEGVPVRVVLPEYLIALYLEPAARTPRRRERAALLMELPALNLGLLREIMTRHGLEF